MVADHDEDQGHCHERVVPRAGLSAVCQSKIRLSADLQSGNHLTLRWDDRDPHARGHDCPEHRPNMHVRSSASHVVRQSKRNEYDKSKGDGGADPFILSQR